MVSASGTLPAWSPLRLRLLGPVPLEGLFQEPRYSQADAEPLSLSFACDPAQQSGRNVDRQPFKLGVTMASVSNSGPAQVWTRRLTHAEPAHGRGCAVSPRRAASQPRGGDRTGSSY